MKNALRLMFCLGLISVLARLTILSFCGFLFACGCSWSEGITHCNIFDAQRPDCPWCSLGIADFWGLFGLILGLSGATTWAALNWIRPSTGVGLVAALASYWWWGSLVGLATALYQGYPIFYGITLYSE